MRKRTAAGVLAVALVLPVLPLTAAGAAGEKGSGFGSVSLNAVARGQEFLFMDQIPAQLRSLVGARIDVRQVEAWDEPDEDGRHGTVVVEVVGAPVRLTGRTSLRAVTPYACTLSYDGELRAAVPLFEAKASGKEPVR